MKLHSANGSILAVALEAIQCAATLVAILGVLGLIAWAAGIASLADLPWILIGAFAGSFVAAVFRRNSRGPRTTWR
jgi:hypothetical protein